MNPKKQGIRCLWVICQGPGGGASLPDLYKEGGNGSWAGGGGAVCCALLVGCTSPNHKAPLAASLPRLIAICRAIRIVISYADTRSVRAVNAQRAPLRDLAFSRSLVVQSARTATARLLWCQRSQPAPPLTSVSPFPLACPFHPNPARPKP